MNYFCSRFLWLSVFPWCRERLQIIMLWAEWFGRLKWHGNVSLETDLSFFGHKLATIIFPVIIIITIITGIVHHYYRHYHVINMLVLLYNNIILAQKTCTSSLKAVLTTSKDSPNPFVMSVGVRGSYVSFSVENHHPYSFDPAIR